MLIVRILLFLSGAALMSFLILDETPNQIDHWWEPFLIFVAVVLIMGCFLLRIFTAMYWGILDSLGSFFSDEEDFFGNGN